MDAVAELFLGLAGRACARVIAVTEPSTGLDEIVFLAAEPGGETELPDQKHGAAAAVVGKNRGAVAMVMDLTVEDFALAIMACVVDRIEIELRPAARQGLDLLDLDARAHCRRSFQTRSRIVFARVRLVRSSTSEERRWRQFGRSLSVPGTLSGSVSPTRSSA